MFFVYNTQTRELREVTDAKDAVVFTHAAIVRNAPITMNDKNKRLLRFFEAVDYDAVVEAFNPVPKPVKKKAAKK